MGENGVLVAVVGAISAIVGGAISAVLSRLSAREGNDINLLAQQGTQLAEAWKRIDSLTDALSTRDDHHNVRVERLEATVRRQRALIRDLVREFAASGREIDFDLYGLDPSTFDHMLGDFHAAQIEEPKPKPKKEGHP